MRKIITRQFKYEDRYFLIQIIKTHPNTPKQLYGLFEGKNPIRNIPTWDIKIKERNERSIET